MARAGAVRGVARNTMEGRDQCEQRGRKLKGEGLAESCCCGLDVVVIVVV